MQAGCEESCPTQMLFEMSMALGTYANDAAPGKLADKRQRRIYLAMTDTRELC
jgi:hypothetical protein